ncbi:ABC transporter ATP-binding protein [Catellatospora chokoriensis]|uniref:Dipeptide/oligopeptide/nickel ABC transporter ATP-binding protein n=1 Tax=Catellatospora chokoriensis TaxID=310353 RepID=A0A8J3NPY4_9ACTN|nr:ABC transporter ATP-binding protein [Catellatospora chokoriensis]GIF87971.1 dipeptide/oligopeptide/nickel ABC transporter ATP-binding protein [Catellatospora chokoriensis]
MTGEQRDPHTGTGAARIPHPRTGGAAGLLEIRDLRVSYRDRGVPLPAVRGVDLVLGAGETLGLAGESGCGKSTLASALLRLLPGNAEVSGEILLNGSDVMKMSWGQLRAVRWNEASIVFQGAMHALNPVRSIGRQIAEAILLHAPKSSSAAARKQVGELLEQVGVPAWRAESYPHELSGGQKQRVMIAMALACSPQLIIADEPTTALDVMVQAQVLTLLKQLVQERGVGLILISHDLSVLASTCDRVAVMYAGRVVEHGPGHRLFADAAHPYAQALAAAFPVIGDMASRRAPRGLPGDPPDPRELGGGCAFAPRCPVALAECVEYDIRLRTVDTARSAACVHVGVKA